MELTARKLGIDPKIVSLIYKSYWKFIKDTIHDLDIENMSEEDFKNITTNFNIPYIGKLYTNYEKLQKYNRKIKFLENNVEVKRNQTPIQSGSGD